MGPLRRHPTGWGPRLDRALTASILVELRQTASPHVHRALQRTEAALEKAYVGSLRVQARLSGFPIPIPQLGVDRGSRVTSGGGTGTYARWRAIEKRLPEGGGVAIDIGSHTGFFSLQLAERGFEVVGYEPALRLYKIANVAASRAEGRFVGFMPVAITPVNASRIFSADVTLALSVFHRWCEAFGFDGAVRILETVWSKTRKVLFFETPNPHENKTIREFVPPMGETPDAIGAAIATILTGFEDSEVMLLGRFPTDFRGDRERRHLFAVARRHLDGEAAEAAVVRKQEYGGQRLELEDGDNPPTRRRFGAPTGSPGTAGDVITLGSERALRVIRQAAP